MDAHRGTCRLRINADATALEGTYYSGRGRQNVGACHLNASSYDLRLLPIWAAESALRRQDWITLLHETVITSRPNLAPAQCVTGSPALQRDRADQRIPQASFTAWVLAVS
jgi:hypothetical protein